jgi:hypothetical protein
VDHFHIWGTWAGSEAQGQLATVLILPSAIAAVMIVSCSCTPHTLHRTSCCLMDLTVVNMCLLSRADHEQQRHSTAGHWAGLWARQGRGGHL